MVMVTVAVETTPWLSLTRAPIVCVPATVNVVETVEPIPMSTPLSVHAVRYERLP
jgi:hypothetical protein